MTQKPYPLNLGFQAKYRLIYLVGELGLGGSERQLSVLLKYLRTDQFEKHVVVFNKSVYGVLNHELETAGVRIWEVPQAVRSPLQRMQFLLGLFRRVRPQIVHSWTVHDNPYAGIIGALAGVPVRLGSLRGSTTLVGFQSLPRFYRWLSLNSVPVIVVNSQSLKNELLSSGYSSTRIKLLANCVEQSCSQPPPADLSALGIPSGARVVGAVGNLRGVKNHAMLVQALAEVIPGDPSLYGLIVGQPIPAEIGVHERLTALIEEKGLAGRVILTGFRDDVPAVLRRFTIFCQTSLSEGMPNAILEAMSAGLPVIATRVGGVPEIVIDGVTGILVESSDVSGLVLALQRLLGDPISTVMMGAAGKERAGHSFECKARADELAAYYEAQLIH